MKDENRGAAAENTGATEKVGQQNGDGSGSKMDLSRSLRRTMRSGVDHGGQVALGSKFTIDVAGSSGILVRR
jgi:hypothetical protein